jgi:hypothetical protein
MRSFCLAIVGIVAIAFPAQLYAQKVSAPKPGSYTDWNDVDQVTIVQPFQRSAYNRVIIAPLDTRNAPLPDKSDNSYNDVKAALAGSTNAFMQGMRDKLAGMQVQTGSGGGANALIVRARITKSDPGSQAARYFAGFGAGAAKVGISGEIIDGKSNKVLVRFTQERRSGVGMFGGGYRELLDRSLRQIGGDVAGLIRAF